jgi:hypothetical protein
VTTAADLRERTLEIVDLIETDQVSVSPIPPPAPPERVKAPPVAQQLIVIGEEICELFIDDRGAPHAAVRWSDARQIVPLSSSFFGRTLAGVLYERRGVAASNEAIGAARRVLAHKAVAGQCHELHNRFAYIDGVLWIDLADDRQQAVRVTADGWIITRPPILFRRYGRQAPLPIPARGGDIFLLRPYLNTHDDNDELLVLTWMVTALLGHIPRPVLDLHGPQGSAKTTVAKMLRRLTDPSTVPTCPLSRADDELALTFERNAVPIFDNVSSITARQADLICQAVTGGGFSKRQLYSDSDEVLYNFRRAIILTGINVASVAPDLLDRFLLVQLDRIGRSSRRAEAELQRAFNCDSAVIFSGMLDALSAAMRCHTTIARKTIPLERMADFTLWGAAVAEGLGLGQDAFMRAYQRNVMTQTEEILEADPVARAIRDLLSAEHEWSGTASQLLSVPRDRVGDIEARGETWPKRAEVLSRRLKTLHSTLAEIGIRIEYSRVGHDRMRMITLREATTVQEPQKASAASARPLLSASNACPADDADIADASRCPLGGKA